MKILSGNNITGLVEIYNPNGNSFNQNLRLPAVNGWSCIVIGCAPGSTSDAGEGVWAILRNNTGQCLIAHNGWEESSGLLLTKDGLLKWLNNIIWHSGNDGSGSGLDADTVDGKQASDFAISAGAGGGIDLNNIIQSGMYRVDNVLTNAPTGVEYGQLLVIHGGNDTVTQIISDWSSTNIYWRSGNPLGLGGSWNAWRKIWHAGIFDPDSKLSLSGGTLTGDLIASSVRTGRVIKAYKNGTVELGIGVDICGGQRELCAFFAGGGGGSFKIASISEDGNYSPTELFKVDASNMTYGGKLLLTKNGGGDNILIGDDAFIGDINLANTIGIRGTQNNNIAYIKFGSGASFGFDGTSLVYGGNTVWHSGNFTPSANGARITTSLTEPGNPSAGDFWYQEL